jgi:hypothetical protein
VVDDRVVDASAMTPAFIHRDEIAWVGTHRHDGAADRNEPYVFCYLFKYGIDIPPGARSVTLPDNDRIKIMAMTAASDPRDNIAPAYPLYDRISAVHLKPRGGLFIEPVQVTLTADDPETEILYTLDGSEPVESSPRYASPLQLTATTTITAQVLQGGVLRDFPTRATFTFTTPREPDKPPAVAAGLDYDYYQGEWRRLPDFAALKPVKSGVVADFSLTPRERDERYGFTFTGYISAPRDGVYTFYTASDDGSNLYIGDVAVVKNDGLHGKRERAGRIALRAGLHPIRVTFFENSGSDELEVFHECAGTAKQLIPAEALFRRKGARAP